MNNHEPKFDGEKWRCARCLSVLATVAQVEELQLPTRERPTMESKRVTVLELPAGYVKPKGRDEYVKPNKTHPFMRGAGQQKDRIKTRRFTERQLETARQKSDHESISEAKRKLAQYEAFASKASEPNADVRPKRFHADELPVRVQCAKPGCKTVSCLTSIRARPNMEQ